MDRVENLCRVRVQCGKYSTIPIPILGCILIDLSYPFCEMICELLCNQSPTESLRGSIGLKVDA